MKSRSRRPSWWQLWLILPALAILALLETRASLSPAGHTAVETAIVLAVFGLVAAWLRANQARLLREPGDGLSHISVETIIYLPSEPAVIAGKNGDGHHQPAWAVPAGEPEADPLAAWKEAGS